jgi:predicted P-loop ATPase
MNDYLCADDVSEIDRDFLAKVIPDDGTYIMFRKRPSVGDKGNLPFGDLDSMAAGLAKFCDRGFDVYHACASFNDGSSRTAPNAKSFRALFVDLDCGDEKADLGKGYATKSEAKAALDVFCSVVGLPRPLLVDSGGGLHAYWPLEEAVPAAEWKTVAVQLKALCAANRLLADPSVTADAARILRPVGSFNRKYHPPRRVRLLEDKGPFSFDTLRALIDEAHAQIGTKFGQNSQRGSSVSALPPLFDGWSVPEHIKNLPSYPAMMEATVRLSSGLVSTWDETPDNVQKVKAMLACIPPDIGRDDWRALAWSVAWLGWTVGEQIFTDWSKGCDKYWSAATDGGAGASKQIEDLFGGYDANRGTSIGTLIYLAREHGFERRTPQASARTSYRELLNDPNRIVRRKEVPLWNLANIHVVLAESNEWCDRFAYDEMADEIMVLTPIPGARTPHKTFKPHQLRDVDILATMVWLQRHHFPNVAKDTVASAIIMAAHEQIISPVRHYLEDQEMQIQWAPDEHESRLHKFCADYLGATEDANTPGSEPTYLAEVGKRFMVSAVARALDPGCQVDSMLVLEGPQGAGKSSAARVLFGNPYFSDSLPAVNTKDASDHLRGKWGIEIPELSAMQKSDVESIKAFVSRRVERYRRAYDRAETTFQRRCVFIGTTNQDNYLRDETGNRRFWPVRVGKIDLPALERDRDMLWAEAVYWYRQGFKWHMPRKLMPIVEAAQKSRVKVDMWQEELGRRLEGETDVSLHEAALKLGLDRTRMGTAEQNRLTACLKGLGFSQNGKFTSGQYRNSVRYSRAPSDAD